MLEKRVQNADEAEKKCNFPISLFSVWCEDIMYWQTNIIVYKMDREIHVHLNN